MHGHNMMMQYTILTHQSPVVNAFFIFL